MTSMLSVEHGVAVLQHTVAAALAGSRQVPVNNVLSDLGTGADDLRNGGAALDSLDQLTVAREVATFFELEKTGAEELLLRRRRLDQWSELIVQGLDEGMVTDLWLRSGGTTGEPKLLPHPVARLKAEVKDITWAVAGTRRIVSLVPLHHIYGLIWGPLLASRLAVPLIHGPAALKTVHEDLRAGDLLIAVPELWRYLAGRRQPFPDGVRGVTSTAPCPPGLIAHLREQGLATVLEIYGSSETGGIGWREDPGDGYRLFGHWQRHDEDHLIFGEAGPVLLPDHVRWGAEGRVTPVRRRDGAVQVGGANVWPARVAAFIERHSAVKACAVRPMEADGGLRLKAFVVPEGSESGVAQADLAAELRTWLSAELPAAERPVQFTVGDALPRNALGKLCDW